MSRDADHKRRQELFEKAQQLAAVGGWEYDLSTKRLYWTDEVRRIFELPPASEPTLQEAIDCFHPADQEAVRTALEAAIDGESFEAEWRLETATGEQRWVRVHGTPNRKAGSVVRVQGAIEDITDRKQHERRLTMVFETSRELLDGDSTDEIASCAVDAAREVLGLTVNGVYLYDEDRDALCPTAVTGDTVDAVENSPTFDRGEGIAWRAFETGEPQVYDDVRTAANVYNPETAVRSELALPLGDYGVFLAGSTEPAAFDDRTLSLANILAADIETALEQLARNTELRETTERLEAIIQHTPDSLFVLDDEGRIVEANDQACASLGYDSGSSEDGQTLLGSHWSAIGTVTDNGESTADSDPLAELRATPDSVITVEGRHTRQDGSTFPVRVRIARIDDGGEGGFLAIARDISELTAQQRQLQRQNDQLEQFASVISHDLQNPLNVITGYLDLVMETGNVDQLEPAANAADRMERLLNDLLTLAREGRAVGELEPTDLESVVTGAWESVETYEATLELVGFENQTTIEADESRLKEAFENLFENAIVYAGEDVAMRVEVEAETVSVADDGPGIPEDQQDKIFEHGHTGGNGTGLGLSIVQSVIEGHDWEIKAAESSEGGARFDIQLDQQLS